MIQMPSQRVVIDELTAAGFRGIKTEKYFVREDLQDRFLYAGKHHPALYLDAQVRKGISSFSALANAKEVETGLFKLEKDIQDQTVNKHLKEYKNDLGDYLFIVTTKPK